MSEGVKEEGLTGERGKIRIERNRIFYNRRERLIEYEKEEKSSKLYKK